MGNQKNIGDRLKEIVILENGCWEWQGWINPDNGYGYICIRRNGDKRTPVIHRYFYEELVGPIPEGLVLDHTCHNNDPDCRGGAQCLHRRCVNPNHLEPVTQQVNTLRGKGLAGDNARKDFCVNGHEFTPENTKFDERRGKRACKECLRANWQRYYDSEHGGEQKRAYARVRMRKLRQDPEYKVKKRAWERERYQRRKAEKEAAKAA